MSVPVYVPSFTSFDHSPWIFHSEPLENVVSGAPNDHAHLSPFSAPLESNQPAPRGSVRASESSWPLTLASAASPCECLPEVSTGSQPASPSRLKKKANWTFVPLHEPQLCQAQ